MKIRWSPTAVADLGSVRSYIAKDSPTAAAKVANTIKTSANRLKDFPLSGRVGRVPETRELVVAGTNYIVAYTIDGEEVFIASVLHGRQSWPESL